MNENFAEQKISNPKQDLEFFQNSLEKKSLSQYGNTFSKIPEEKKDELITQNLKNHEKDFNHLTTPKYERKETEAEKIILNLIPEEDDQVMEKLLGLLQEKGILNTLNAIEKTENFHIKDDFHRVMVQYIKSGYQINIAENSELYPGLHMSLFEISLPESSEEKDKEKSLEILLSSMEQFYAGMFSVAEEKNKKNNYFSIEIAYPQGREEIVFFCAIPNKKKNIFKNQILAIFPNASIKENTNDYNIFNKKENVSYGEANFSKPFSFPIKTYKELNYDPLNILLQSFSNLEKEEGAAIQILLSPESESFNQKIIKALDRIQKGEDIDRTINLKSTPVINKIVSSINTHILGWEKSDDVKDGEKRNIISEEMKLKNSSRFYQANIRLISAGNNQSHAESILSEIESSFFQYEKTTGNSFKFEKILDENKLRKKIQNYTFRIFDRKNKLYLNTTELTTIFHFPEIALNAAKKLATSSFSSSGVSKKILDNQYKENQKKEQEKKDFLQENNSEIANKKEENFSQNISKDFLPEKNPQNNIKDFVLEKPNEDWIKKGLEIEKKFEKKEEIFSEKFSDEKKEEKFKKIPELKNKIYQNDSEEKNFEQKLRENFDDFKEKKELENIDNLEKKIEPKILEDLREENFSKKEPEIFEKNIEEKNQKNSQQNLGDASFSESENILLGYNLHQGEKTDIYMKSVDRMRHMYVIGKSGVGKTNILKNMIIQDIKNGDGCCFMDPHGSDIEDILSQIPKERHKDVIYFDPTNIKKPMGMNMLEYDPNYPEQKSFVVDELFGIFKKLYSDTPESMGPAFEQYFRNATLLVLEHPESGCTMVEISRVLSDESFRNLKLKYCKNMIVKQFWEKIAGQAGGDMELANVVPYITNKFDVFLANDFLRPIIAQDKSAFNFRDVMDNRKILLVNLSKGKLGELNSNLIGLILVGKILMSALSRVDSLDKNLPPFYLYIDEFQNVTTNSISQILSEARKYKLSLNIAHQYIKQIDEGIRDAVFGNVGSMAVFRVGSDDAEFLEKQFAPTFSSSDIINLNNYNAYIKILVDGEPQKPFNISTYPPEEGNLEMKQYLKDLGSEKYGRDREIVEKEVNEKFASIM